MRAQRAMSTGNYGFDPLADDKDAKGLTHVDGYTRAGFVVNGARMQGTLLALPRASFRFAPSAVAELTPHALEWLLMLKAPPAMLLVGGGPTPLRPPADVVRWLQAEAIGVETLPTRDACSTFNFMVQERRSVAAVLFPSGY